MIKTEGKPVDSETCRSVNIMINVMKYILTDLHVSLSDVYKRQPTKTAKYDEMVGLSRGNSEEN